MITFLGKNISFFVIVSRIAVLIEIEKNRFKFIKY